MAGRERAAIGLLMLIAVVAVAVRVNQTYVSSWWGGQLVPYDSDPYYQLRRVELFTCGDYPPGGRDRFAIAPDTFRCPWPAGLPVLLGVVAVLVSGGDLPSRTEIERTAAWTIPVLGALPVLLMGLLLWRFDRERGGHRTALLGALALAVLPTARMVGHFARIDHHVLEPAAAIALFVLTPATFALPASSRPGGVLLGTLVAFVCALTLDLAYLILGLLTGLQVVLALTGSPSAPERSRLAGVALGAALATGLDFVTDAPRVLPIESRFAIAGGYFAAGLLVGATPRLRRWAWVLLALAAATGATGILNVASLWSGAEDPITKTMTESGDVRWRAIGAPQAAFHAAPALAGLLGLLLLPGLRNLALGLYVALIGLAMLVQIKYQSLFSIAEATGWALLPPLLLSLIPPAMRLLRRIVTPAVVLLMLTGSAVLARPNPPLAHVAVARDLARLAAQLPGIADPAWCELGADPGAIVLAHPVDGARFGYLARVAVAGIPFWSQRASLERYVKTLELLGQPWGPSTDRELRRNRARYVLVATELPKLQMHEHLRLLDGTANRRGYATDSLRLVGEAGSAKLFERVTGARIEGRAEPDATVAVQAEGRTPAGRALVFLVVTRAGPDGTFRLRFPYSNEAKQWPTRIARIVLRCPGQQPRPFPISEHAVQSGERLSAGCLP